MQNGKDKCPLCEKRAKIEEQNTKDYAELHNKYLKLEQILNEIKQKIEHFEILQDFSRSQQEQNSFIMAQLRKEKSK